jgi:hypothetical protein
MDPTTPLGRKAPDHRLAHQIVGDSHRPVPFDREARA